MARTKRTARRGGGGGAGGSRRGGGGGRRGGRPARAAGTGRGGRRRTGNLFILDIYLFIRSRSRFRPSADTSIPSDVAFTLI